MTPNPLPDRSGLSPRSAGGFTLTENLMALTVIITVAVPLVGLLGMAVSSRDIAGHRREAAQLARQIAAELAHSTAELGAPSDQAVPLIAVRPPSGQADDWPYLDDLPSNLADRSIHVAYDLSLRPAGEMSDGEYASGVPVAPPSPGGNVDDTTPHYAVRIAFTPAGPDQPDLYRATVTVGSPAQAAEPDRRRETFITLVRR